MNSKNVADTFGNRGTIITICACLTPLYYHELANQNLPEAALGNIETLIDWIDQTPEMDGDNISVIVKS